MLTMRTDAEAIADSRDDPERFAEIFDRYFSSIHGFVQRRVDKGTADDLAAETFARPSVSDCATTVARTPNHG